MRFCLLVILLLIQFLSFTQKPGSGNTLRFDGTSTRIVHEALFNNLDLPLTVSYWMKINGMPRSVERLWASCYTPDNVYYGFSSHFSAGGVNVNYGDGRGALHPSFRRGKKYFFSSDISDTWIHVAISIRGARDMSIHINGRNVGGNYSGSGLSMAVNSSCETIIGYGSDNNGIQYLNGELDEIRVWNYSRSIDQIRSDMTRKLVGNETGLIGYWNFETGSGSEAEELISGNKGSIEGNVNWVLSGAPIGDESFFEYFSAGAKKKLFKNNTDSFWISTESDNWVGYHVYRVNESPNSEEGSTIDLSDGYYGVYPIFENEESGEYRIDFGNAECSVGDFRNGNSDVTWEGVIEGSDSSMYFAGSEVVEFSYETNGSSNSIEDIYYICAGESIVIDASSECTTVYNWFDTSTEAEIEIFESGEYWLERTTPFGTFRDDFVIEIITTESDFLSKDFYFICENEFPLTLEAKVNEVFSWSTGESGQSIEVSSRGIYWAEYISDCGYVRDSVFVEVVEFESDFFIEDFLFVCKSEFPFLIESTLDQNLNWNTGIEAKSLLVDSSGFYWAEYLSDCGIVRDSVFIELKEVQSDFLKEDSYFVCENEFPISIESSLDQDLNWSNGSLAKSISVGSSGLYWAEYMSDCGLIRDSVFVSIPKYNSDFLSEDLYSICKSDLPFVLKTNLNHNVMWSTGDRDSSIAINSSGVYWAEYQTSCGVIRDSVRVEIAKLNDVFIPNVLTPNNDGVNDCLIIDGDLSQSELLVFNRAGIEVFRSEQYQNNWCPENIPSGVYYYQISNTCYQESFKGWISILK